VLILESRIMGSGRTPYAGPPNFRTSLSATAGITSPVPINASSPEAPHFSASGTANVENPQFLDLLIMGLSRFIDWGKLYFSICSCLVEHRSIILVNYTSHASYLSLERLLLIRKTRPSRDQHIK
jgi:hypothetical protein